MSFTRRETAELACPLHEISRNTVVRVRAGRQRERDLEIGAVRRAFDVTDRDPQRSAGSRERQAREASSTPASASTVRSSRSAAAGRVMREPTSGPDGTEPGHDSARAASARVLTRNTAPLRCNHARSPSIKRSKLREATT